MKDLIRIIIYFVHRGIVSRAREMKVTLTPTDFGVNFPLKGTKNRAIGPFTRSIEIERDKTYTIDHLF